MHNDIAKILVSETEIAEICTVLGAQLTEDYKDKNPLLVGLLKGCIPFMSDLSRKINLKFDIAYMSVSSYHGGIASSGDVKIKMDLDISIKDVNFLMIPSALTYPRLSHSSKLTLIFDGISLTVGQINDANNVLTVWLIPETLERTNLSTLLPGDLVNIEVDVLAKYVERLLAKGDQ